MECIYVEEEYVVEEGGKWQEYVLHGSSLYLLAFLMIIISIDQEGGEETGGEWDVSLPFPSKLTFIVRPWIQREGGPAGLCPRSPARIRHPTSDGKAKLVREFDEHKANKACGLRISVKSRVNDVTHTMKAIENEVSIYERWLRLPRSVLTI
jgi:hypothetical protein